MVFLYLQSAPSFVQALTDASFDAVVMNPESDVLVEFYAPVRLGVHRHTFYRSLPLTTFPLSSYSGAVTASNWPLSTRTLARLTQLRRT